VLLKKEIHAGGHGSASKEVKMWNNSNINYVEIPNKLKFLISLIAFFLILIHGLMPLAVIDSITIALFIIAVFPWILPYIKNMPIKKKRASVVQDHGWAGEEAKRAPRRGDVQIPQRN
jgi:hypothetical protein